mgnify:FL=1|tara:strand:+ start:214 stop:675 length:462 start_codon:yes stop_codon:yes gene_type:complete
MNKDMKLIIERWKNFVVKEQDEIQTVGQLKKIINIHRALEAGKETGKKAAEIAIERIPGLGDLFAVWKGAKDAKEIIGKLYSAKDNFKTSTALDNINVDDDVSKIVDDPIEVAFIKDLLQTLAEMDDTDPIPDVNVELQKYLYTKFNGNQVKK